MWFNGGIVSGTFPTRSFVKGDGITSGVPIVVHRKSMLQGGMDREIGCSGYNAVIFQYSVGINDNSVFPQMSSEYGRSRGDFVKICNRMVYYSIISLAQDVSAVINECPEFG